MKKLVFVFMVILFSCSDETECYICNTTHVITTSVPVVGYPKITEGSELEICDSTEGIAIYENANKGASSQTNSQGIIITDTYSTECLLK